MSRPGSSLLDRLIRIVTLALKEIIEVVQQPKLVASLVVGPFAILVLFGMGYAGPRPVLHTILVFPETGSPIIDLQSIEQGFTGVFDVVGVTRDEAQARAALLAGKADVVVILPSDIYRQVYEGQQPTLRVLYHEADPTASSWVRYFTQVQTARLNRHLLLDLLGETNAPIDRSLAYLDRLQAGLDRLSAALASGQTDAAIAQIDDSIAQTQNMPIELAAALAVASAEDGPGTPLTAASLDHALRDLQSEIESGASLSSLRTAVQALQQRLRTLDTTAHRLNAIPRDRLVSPLMAQVENLIPFNPTTVNFYAPAVLALILQHVGLTLSAMSGVRDRELGIFEIYWVSPISAAELIVGKAVGFGLLLGLLGVFLTVVMTRLLGVPMVGNLGWFAVTLIGVIFASVTLGFALASVAGTESQVVQLAMLVLLTSVFLGGLFLPLDLLAAWLRAAAYALPATLAAIGLRDVMLQGHRPGLPFLLGPFGLGVILFGIALFRLRARWRASGER
ncbi:MAG: ABC transporter permease [Chloroflexi bacterium]|nr:ABC transporter permease [Chloroflexota bacterium]